MLVHRAEAGQLVLGTEGTCRFSFLRLNPIIIIDKVDYEQVKLTINNLKPFSITYRKNMFSGKKYGRKAKYSKNDMLIYLNVDRVWKKMVFDI